ncbi:oligopeptide transporter [Penicillium malachiteum]|nr:oligopeptide transporter [Penicillium malachiteum]
MNASDPIDLAEIARSNAAAHDTLIHEKIAPHEPKVGEELIEEAQVIDPNIDGRSPDLVYPNEEELMNLRRVADSLPWAAYTVAFAELFVNFIQRPLSKGSKTGALPSHSTSKVPGALGMGQRASTGLTLCDLPCKPPGLSTTANGIVNQFWNYMMPLAGAYVADRYWGRFKTIFAAIAATLLGHIMLICSAIPAVIAKPGASIACFTIGLVVMGFGTGGFKPNISTLIGEQYRHERPFIRLLPSGERVIVDPAATISRIYLYFYLMVNAGSLMEQISMVYCERFVGFYLSFLLPTVMYLFCPAVLYLCRSRYHLTAPTGSVYSQVFRLWMLTMKGRWSLNPMKIFKQSDTTHFWDQVKPSKLGSNKPQWMKLDDEWVDEVRRGLSACAVFLWYPLYWLAYNQITSQAATMRLGGIPNDIINNLNPLSLILYIPIMDHILYPGLRRMGFRFTPLRRITAGFIVAGCAMISATVTQYYIYKKNPCEKNANYCLEKRASISEIFTSVTSLEYAFTKAPRNMRSLVQAVSLFMNAFSSAIGRALVGLSADPLLEWNYGVTAILAFIGGIGFWLTNYKLDRDEDRLNMPPHSQFAQIGAGSTDEEK